MSQKSIALLTDFGLKDPYVGVMKGIIAGISPNANVIDITHEILPHNIAQASFILAKTYKYFPRGTIFLCVVDPGVGGQRRAIAVKTKEYFFVAPDNGIVSLALQKEIPEEIVEITKPEYMRHPVSRTFHGRDIFAPSAAHIAAGIEIKQLGDIIFQRGTNQEPSEVQSIFEYIRDAALPHLQVEGNYISGNVIFADHFGNLITNIDKENLENKQIDGIQIGPNIIRRINRSYEETPKGELLAIIGSYDTLEIAVNQGSAAQRIENFDGIKVKILFSHSMPSNFKP